MVKTCFVANWRRLHTDSGPCEFVIDGCLSTPDANLSADDANHIIVEVKHDTLQTLRRGHPSLLLCQCV
jgi:hypothetical protein